MIRKLSIRLIYFVACICVGIFLFANFANAQNQYQENNEALQIELRELEEMYSDSQQKIQVASLKLDELLAIGYKEMSARKELQHIADIVGTEDTIIKDLGTKISALIKKLGGGLKPMTVVVRRGDKNADPLVASAKEGDILYFTAKAEQPFELSLKWSIRKPNGQISDRLHKEAVERADESKQYFSFGIDTTGMDEGEYQVMLEYSLTSEPNKKYNSTTNFEIGGTLNAIKILRLVVDDERSGDKHKSALDVTASAYLFTYYEVPEDVDALTIRYRLRDWTDRKNVFEKTGRRNTKQGKAVQRVGILLDKNEVPLIEGHQYRFDIRLTDDLRASSSIEKYETQSKNVFFYYGKEPKQVEIKKIVVGTSESSTKYVRDVPKQEGPIFLNLRYKANGGVGSVNVDIKLKKVSDKTVVFHQSFQQVIDTEKKIKEINIPVDIDKFEIDTKYRVEVLIAGEEIDPTKKSTSFFYAPIPPADMRKYVRVNGLIQTPSFPDVKIKQDGDNFYYKNSTIVFDLPAQTGPSFKGELIWRCKYGCGANKKIKLSDNPVDWGYSFKVKNGRGFGGLTLVHQYKGKSVNLDLPKFRVIKPFSVKLLPSNSFGEREKLYPWELDNTRLQIRANAQSTSANVSVKVTLDGKLITELSKSMSLPADKWVEWSLGLDPARFKYDLAEEFPSINKYSFSKNIKFVVDVKYGNGDSYADSFSRSANIYRLNKDNLKEHAGTPESPLIYTIILPPEMTGPYQTSILGNSVFHMEGLKWYYDPDKLEEWVREVGARKYKEDTDRIYYKKTIPLLITIEDITGKQAALFFDKFTYSASIYKEQE